MFTIKNVFSFEFVVYVRLRLGQGSIEISSTFIKQIIKKLYIFDSKKKLVTIWNCFLLEFVVELKVKHLKK